MHYKIHYGNSTVNQSVSREARVKYSKKQQKKQQQQNQQKTHTISLSRSMRRRAEYFTPFISRIIKLVFHSFAGCYKNKHRLYFSNRRLVFVAAVVEGRECFI